MRLSIVALLSATAMLGQQSSFVKDVAPVFANYCYGCHSGAVKMSDLDLETAEGIARGGKGGPAVVPFKPDESRLLLTVDPGRFHYFDPQTGHALLQEVASPAGP